MGLISKTVIMKWNPRNKKYYEELGYVFTTYGDEFEVKVEDLAKGSMYKVQCICDNCGEMLPPWTYQSYNRSVKEDGKTYCNKCAKKIYGVNNIKKTRLKNSKSFYDWCIENNRQDLLDRWDYELNGCSPKDVCYGSGDKYYFKCLKHSNHKSELKKIDIIVSGKDGVVNCKQCNSVAQYILDNFPDKKLEEVWDYEKNGDLDPWKICRGSNKIKVWIKCQEKDYHGSYEVKCNNFTQIESRCPYCLGKKVHSKDSLGQYIIDNFREDFLWKVWSNKNVVSPFEISPNSHKKVWWNCVEDKHEPYERSCASSTRLEYRCSKCVEERKDSIIEEKTRLYLEKLGYEVLTEYRCSILPHNPKTKQPLPFDNEIVLKNGKHLIIEVHGIQHYKITGYYNKTKEDLEYQQYKDKYKKDYCIQMGYEYLEIPYTAFDKKETYKKLINNKIKEILDK